MIVLVRQTASDRRSHAGLAGAPPLRVCHVMSADLWAGAEIQLATTAAYLTSRPEVRMTAVLLNEGRLAVELRALGVRVAIVDEHHVSAAGIVRFLMRFFNANGVNVVHTHRHSDSILGILAAKAAGVPHVVRTMHGLREPMSGWNSLRFRAYEALEALALRGAADRVVAVSGQMARALVAGTYPASMVACIRNGIDLSRVRPRKTAAQVRRDLGVAADAPLLGTAGRLSPVKGHLHLLRAARHVLQVHRDARILIAGSGPLRQTLLDEARRLRIDHACRLVGDRADVFDLMAALDVFVLPSLNEGLPMALLEAMALGTPVVASDVGGIPEVVRHRATGLLAPPGDEVAVAEACLALVRHREWARRLAADAQLTVRRQFSHQRAGAALLQLYRELGCAHAGAATTAHTPAAAFTVRSAE